MRLPLAVGLESRDGGVTKDAKVLNGLIEKVSDQVWKLRKRPGLSDQGSFGTGTAQLITYWQGRVRTVIGDYFGGAIISGSAVVLTTWNPSDKGSDITLSNGNLTATEGVTAHSVRATVSKATGKWYWEVTIGANANNIIGVANSTHSLTVSLYADVNGMGYQNTGDIRRNSNLITTGATYTTGDVIGVAFDADNRTCKFYKNNVLQATIATVDMPTGTLFPAWGGGGAGGVGTVNFGATATVYVPPLGYTTIDTPSSSLAPSTAGLPFSAQDNGNNAPIPYLMIKNASQGWVVNQSGTVTQISDVDYPGTYAVTLTSLTRSGTTATATTATDTNFQVGSTVTIAGATPVAYNGAQVITGITASVSINNTPVEIWITRSGTTATATSFGAPHGFSNGQSVTIAGADQAAYNGQFTITWISGTQFSFTVTVTNSVTSPATGSFSTIVLVTNLEPCTISIAAGTATVTWFAHGLETAASVAGYIGAENFGGATGVAIVVVNANSFTFATTLADRGPSLATISQVFNATVTGITASGTTATATTSTAHHLTRFLQIYIFSGSVSPSYYATPEGGVPVTVTSSTTFTYTLSVAGVETPATPATGTITAQGITVTPASFTFTIAGSPATPATGTITATGGRNTVPGIAYVDGRFLVGDINGVLYESAEDDPSIWNALEFTIAQAETGAGKAVARSLQYVLFFKEWSTEFFWNAQLEPPGATFAPVPNLFTLVGCASGFSVAEVAGSLFWIAQAKKQRGRSIYAMAGTSQQKVSTPDVERILNADDLAGVTAYGISLDGHACYVLTLTTTGITLVYDLGSGEWTQWSSLTIGSNKSITSITRSGTTATVTFGSAHAMSDGDPLLISGANQSDYNGIFQVSYVSTTILTVEVANSPVTPATGTLIGNAYAESYFKFTKYADCGGLDMVLHESDGHVYQILSTLYRDAGIPVNYFARTKRLDGGSTNAKKCARAIIVGSSVSDTAMIRWSDDDSTTFSSYRRATLSDEQPMIRRLGSFRRRSFEVRHVGNTAPVIEALELGVSE